MFKSKLQEICHQQKWGLPKYNFIKEGPDHNPSFKASVTVNDVTFDTTIYSKSSKEAQNSAAELAVLHFTASEPRAEPKTGDPVIEIHQAEEMHSDSSVFKNDELNSYKMMLQTYTQRKKVGMPVYTSVKTGLPHALCFKATVIVAGHPFESLRSCKTLKEAEHAAAQVALLSFTLDDFQQIGSPLYKNMLQELAQNEGFTLPKYKTEHCFELHYPSFISTVEVEGEIFHGAAARSKKQAESNAAKVAYTAFMEHKLVVSTSCSLLHTAVDKISETELDEEFKSWLAFAGQKVVEVNALAEALTGNKDEAFFTANSAALASRMSSQRVTDEAVQKAVATLKGSDHRRGTSVGARLEAQQLKLNLPILPTTTIGSFPQTMELRKVRREYKANKISEEVYVNIIKDEINKVVKLQEELDIDVLVHGEPERNDMVEYFGEQLSGFAFTLNGWVQSYGSRCVKPPIIYGDVSRPKAMTVFWSSIAQSMTKRPMKGMLTGPVTILNWSFVRDDQPRFETCYQIALAIKNEVEDLEKAGIDVIQIDEAALREGLPLRKAEQAFYLDWAVQSFRITNAGVKDTTQIHTHMCYSNFNDIILSIMKMDADVITIENSRSDQKLLSVFHEGVKYSAGIGPGVYDIHSPRVPSTQEIVERIKNSLAVLGNNILWVNPDCGLKTRKYSEVRPALSNMVAAAKHIRTQISATKLFQNKEDLI